MIVYTSIHSLPFIEQVLVLVLLPNTNTKKKLLDYFQLLVIVLATNYFTK